MGSKSNYPDEFRSETGLVLAAKERGCDRMTNWYFHYGTLITSAFMTPIWLWLAVVHRRARLGAAMLALASGLAFTGTLFDDAAVIIGAFLIAAVAFRYVDLSLPSWGVDDDADA
jgi:hypothetical protein